MHINSSRLVPNHFYDQIDSCQDSYRHRPPQPIKSPFKEVVNTPTINSHKKRKNPRTPKTFIELESNKQIQEGQRHLSEKLPNKENQGEEVENEEVEEQVICLAPKINILTDFMGELCDTERQSQAAVEHENSKTEVEVAEQSESEKEEEVVIPSARVIGEPIKLEEKRGETDWQIASDEQGMFRRIPEGVRAQCLLRRDKQTHHGNVQFNIYHQSTLKHLLTVRKEGIWQHCFYLRTPNSTMGFSYHKIATLESNFIGNKFTLLQAGDPFSSMTIKYETNLLGRGGPRKLNIYLPKIQVPEEYLDEAYEDPLWGQHIQKCVSRTAKWNAQVNAYVLNFHGRAAISSIKNFVITDPEELSENEFVVFGKAASETFSLDVEQPFSLIQGIALAISTFERKFTCD